MPLILTKPLSRTVRVSGVTLYNHLSNVLCLRVSYVIYKGILKGHIIDNNTMNLLWTLWVDMPWFSSHNYLCCIGEVSPYSYDQCKWFDVRLLHLQCINNGNECVALSGWTCIFPGIWGGLLAPRHSPGSPIPLTGLRLWQDPVMGGWPWAVFGCVALPMWACTIVMLIPSLSGLLLLLSLSYAGYECTCCTACVKK